MSFGGFAPLPERLGGTPENGRTASQHARHVADTLSLRRTAHLCKFIFTTDGVTVTISGYNGANGNGLALAPDAVTLNGTGDVSFQWASGAFVDDYEIARPITVHGFQLGAQGAAFLQPVGEVISAGVRVRLFNAAGAAANGSCVVTISSGITLSIAEYDGAPDKEDSITEGDEPYAYQWYRAYESMLGDGFTNARTGIVHAKKLAMARLEAGKQRAAERVLANSIPSTADECLEAWAIALSVPYRTGPDRLSTRLQCAAKFQTGRGPTAADIDTSLETILGSLYVESIRQTAQPLSTPPTQTYWPGGTPGPPSLSIGGPPWFSERAHLVVRVTYPQAGTQAEFLRLVNTDLFQYLDRRLPATASFNWAGWSTDVIGFFLDISPLDLTGLTPS